MSTILSNLPKEAEITRMEFEGPRIALYTKNPKFLQQNSNIISDIVNNIKRRVVIRTEKTIRKPEEEVKIIIDKAVHPEAKIKNIFFDSALGEVIIETLSPKKLTSGKNFNLIDLTDKTGWKIKVRKTPNIPSTSIQNIYHALSLGSEDREKFFRNTGEEIFRKRTLPENDITIFTLGGFKQVGRSCMLVTTSESKILLDCGIHPGVKESWKAYPRLDWVDLDLNQLDAVVISHAHLDHTGFLPMLYKYGYQGPTYCSDPTLALMTLLQIDSVKIADKEGGKILYDLKDIREVIKHTITLPYGLVTDISPDTKLVMNNAGHILGSATIHLHIGEGAHNIVYTGDFKYGKTLLLDSAVWNYPRVETLIMESTYGAREDVMPSRIEVEEYFVNTINNVIKQGGKVVIPVPAVGRSQEMMLVLDKYMREKKMIEAPIFIEGMISEATAIHIAYPEYLAKDLRMKILEGDENPFLSDYFTVVDHAKNREEALEQGPAIIMATSGMLEGGPVIDYFSKLASSDKNGVVFVSYQIPGTMGRRVLDGSKQVSILDERGKIKIVDVNCEVSKVEGFSGHSDYNQLMRYVGKLRSKLQHVIINHGERRKIDNMANMISRTYRLNTIQPSVQEAIKLH
ncbi:beta-CASP ribonuclease aCPSF1 [Thermoproteota archaeon]